MRNRKGDLSITVIITAAIALLILVIIAALLIRQYGKVNTVTEKCGGGLGECMDRDSCINEKGGTPTPDPTCGEGKICCLPKPS